MRRLCPLVYFGILVLSALVRSGEAVPEKIQSASTAEVTVEKLEYMGWKDCLRVRNAVCELVVVPQVGRVLHFSLAGKENTLYVNRALLGQTVAKDDGQWHNFGGDKVWPTQQDLWIKYTKKNAWPPPYHFDGAPASAEPIPGGIRLRTAQSPQFGASCVREFRLDPQKPLVRVKQHFNKTEGEPAEMTLWSVMQVRKPLYALLPLGEMIDGKLFKALSKEPLKHDLIEGFLILKNQERATQKVGNGFGSGWIAAVYEDVGIVKSHRLSKAGSYPDGGCAQEIFTADAPLESYVELELLGPLETVKAGQKLAEEEVWQLVPLTKEQSESPAKAGEALKAAHKEAMEKGN